VQTPPKDARDVAQGFRFVFKGCVFCLFCPVDQLRVRRIRVRDRRHQQRSLRPVAGRPRQEIVLERTVAEGQDETAIPTATVDRGTVRQVHSHLAGRAAAQAGRVGPEGRARRAGQVQADGVGRGRDVEDARP